MVSVSNKFEDGSLGSFSRIIILFQWNNGCCLFFRCGYITTNHDICYTFVPKIIFFVIRLLNSYIIMILLTVVLYPRLCLIIQGIMLSRIFPIVIWSFSLKLFVSRITLFSTMGDSLQLIGGLVPISLT